MHYLGHDVHDETIAVAVAELDGSVRELETIRHRTEAVRTPLAKLGGPAQMRVCYTVGRRVFRSTVSSPRSESTTTALRRA